MSLVTEAKALSIITRCFRTIQIAQQGTFSIFKDMFRHRRTSCSNRLTIVCLYLISFDFIPEDLVHAELPTSACLKAIPLETENTVKSF